MPLLACRIVQQQPFLASKDSWEAPSIFKRKKFFPRFVCIFFKLSFGVEMRPLGFDLVSGYDAERG
jgi:hypothetical protein